MNAVRVAAALPPHTHILDIQLPTLRRPGLGQARPLYIRQGQQSAFTKSLTPMTPRMLMGHVTK